MNEARLQEAAARWAAGESPASIARSFGVSGDTVWRWLGKPTRFMSDAPTESPEPLFVAWAAGFFDGEGCVSVSRDGRLTVIVSQATPEPILALRTAFGGQVNVFAARGNHKEQWRWFASGELGLRFLEAVQPQLRVKGPQAALALTLRGSKRGRGRPLTADDIAARTVVYEEMARLNRRGRTSP